MDISTIYGIVTTLYDALKRILLALPKAIEKYRFKRFFGKSSLEKNQTYIVIDSYSDPRPRNTLRYIKDFLGRRPSSPLIGGNIIYGTNTPQAIGLISRMFATFRENPIQIVIDTEVNSVMDATLICLGSSDSNLKTYDIELILNNHFYQFNFGPDGMRRFYRNNIEYGLIQMGPRVFDRAVLLKTRNPSNPEYTYIICAGLSEWGTLGSAYYLANHWKDLYKRYKDQDFCEIIEVLWGQPETAHPI